MTIDKWREVVGQIKDQFGLAAERYYQLDERGGQAVEEIEFNSPLGLIKLVFSQRPRLLDKKIQYHQRIGSEVAVDYIYSPTEKITELTAWRFSEADDDWQPLDNDFLNLQHG